MTPQEPVTVLLHRYQAGDESAAAALYCRYAERLCALAREQLGADLRRRLDPEDIVQSVFRSFFRRSRDGEFVVTRSEALWGLLVTIARNKIRGKAAYHRAQQRDVTKEVPLDDAELSVDLIAAGPTPLEAGALAEEVTGLFQGLKPVEVEMLTQCLEGRSTPEIAARVGYSRQTVWRFLDRLRSRLHARRQRHAES
jgi:RNA polymerase sigma factor (sigma-70 family)